MYEAIQCYLVKPYGRSKYWKMRHRLPGETKETQVALKVRDERTAERMMLDFVKEQDAIRHGVINSPKVKEAANANLEASLRAHLKDLQAQNCDPAHVESRGLLIRRLAKDAGWTTIRDITAESFQDWRVDHQELAPRTRNNYLAEMRAFLNWLESRGKLSEDPLKGVQRVKAHEKARPRRAITDVEIARLLAAAPPERRIIYMIAFHTGLRRKEIKLLEWQDVFLDDPEPFIRLRAVTTKNRKGGEVSIHPELKAELKKLGEAAPQPCARVVKMFAGLGPLKKDIAAAGIPFVERGLRFDLHATRKTFNTRLANGNVPTRAAMHAMRHSDEKLTTVVYTDAFRLNVAAHVASLPSLLAPAVVSARASGKGESEGNRSPLGDTVDALTIELENVYHQEFSHAVTQSGTLCLSWGKSSLTRTRT
jgi:integrase